MVEPLVPPASGDAVHLNPLVVAVGETVMALPLVPAAAALRLTVLPLGLAVTLPGVPKLAQALIAAARFEA